MVSWIGPNVTGLCSVVLAQLLEVHGPLYWLKCYRSMVGFIGPNVRGPWSAVLAQLLEVHGPLYLPNC